MIANHSILEYLNGKYTLTIVIRDELTNKKKSLAPDILFTYLFA